MCYSPTWGMGWAHCYFATGTLKDFQLRSNSSSRMEETVREDKCNEIPHIRHEKVIFSVLRSWTSWRHCITCLIKWVCPAAESLSLYYNVTTKCNCHHDKREQNALKLSIQLQSRFLLINLGTSLVRKRNNKTEMKARERGKIKLDNEKQNRPSSLYSCC